MVTSREPLAHAAVRSSSALIAGLALFAADAPRSLAATYAFTKVADSAVDDLDPFSMGAPSLSDMGHVAFSSQSADQSISRVLRTGPSLARPLVMIADSSVQTTLGAFSSSVSVNNSGQVGVWTPDSSPGLDERIIRGDGGGLTAIALAGTGRQFNFMSVVVSVNDAGAAAWQGELNQSGFPEGLFTSSGGMPANVIFSTASSGFTSSFAGPAINNAGQIAFRASTTTSHGDAIFRFDGGSTFTTIADSSGPLSAAFDDEPAINSAGRIAVIGRSDDISTQILLVGDGTAPPVAVVDTTGQLSSIGAASINDSNQIAFIGLFDDFFTQGIFAGPNLTTDRVIRTGDALDGSTVTRLDLFREALNNSGRIAFFAELADGRGVIMVASPAVPACPGDVSGDLMVGVADVAAIINCWGQPGACNPAADQDGSGTIGLGDVAVVIAHWGASCP